jgi:hypothetical protein
MKPPVPPKWPALRVLQRRVGFWRLVKIGLAIKRHTRRGEPFGSLPQTIDERERACRGQIGPAILLYRVLQETGFAPAEAFSITEDVAVASAMGLLKVAVGPLRSAELAAMSEGERLAFVSERGERFPNATIHWEQVTPTQVAFRVTSCRFSTLCAEAGAPELAPIFCKGDAVFFGSVEPNVVLHRDQTIASGADDCPFVLRWMEGEDRA